MLKEKIHSQLSEICQKEFGVVPDFTVEHPADPAHGDYASNIAMVLAREVGKNPMKIAAKIVSGMESGVSSLEKIEVAGPGFINFWLSKKFLISQLSARTSLAEPPSKGKKYMVEFAHPNTLKLFHIGHLRNIALGESVVRLLESQKIKVVRANYQGDVGLHIAKCLWALGKLKTQNSKLKTLKEKINLLGYAYAKGNKAYDEDEKAKKEIVELNKKIYEKNPQIMPLWKKTRQWSLDYFEEIYKRVNTHFDRYYFESEVADSGKQIVWESLKKDVFEKSEGAVIFNGEKFGLHKRVFITKDDFPTYEAKDMGLARLQFSEYNLDKCIHVVGPEQKGYFAVVFKALEFTEPKTKGKEFHLEYGWVRLKEGKMSSRTGSVVTASWLLDEIKKRVFPMIDVDKEYSEREKEQIAEKVTIAAAKYSLLKFAPNTEIAFDIDESISLTGNSGPYLQYTFARTQSVLRKNQETKGLKNRRTEKPKNRKIVPQFLSSSVSQLKPEELAILRTLYKFPEIVAEATESYTPNLICNFLFDLAQKFNTFYEKLPILKAESEEVWNLRLNLTTATGQIIKDGLYLLGIEVPERM
ncbi:MAG: arginine--tRNA ligase [Candidatus Cloacimonetes bacterium]|nr:arginine--tRNA ligase [Candidatus Cloacimonadota bacterium]